jgi:plasmid segregation protein ParM
MSYKNIIYAGIDDGHRDLKMKLSNGLRIAIQSRAASGLTNKISINGTKNGVCNYNTDNGPFSMGDIDHADETAYDDYPLSAQNRVIVAHGLRTAGLTENDHVYAITGLPLKRYYLKGKPNSQLILAKKENLLRRDVVGIDGYRGADIVKHDVVSEGIAAWISYILQRDETGKVRIDRERLMERTAIVDIGGRTLDIAVVRNWDLDGDRSGTEEIGMISIINGAKERLSDEFDGLDLTDEQVEQAVLTKRIKVYGKYHDVPEIIEASIMSTVNSLRSSIKRRLKQAGDIDNVFFVGGTTKFLEPHLQGWFNNQSTMEDPVFANADGMLKFSEFVMGKKG